MTARGRSASAARHQARLATLVFVTHGDEVLLLRHGSDSDRFPGRWNGLGGHVESGEDVREAARRELREEAGLDLPDLRLRAVIHESGLLGHAYVVFGFVGESSTRRLRAAPGLEIAWHPVSHLRNLPLVEDLVSLLPRVLVAEEPLFVTELYDGSDRRVALWIGDGTPGRPAPPGG